MSNIIINNYAKLKFILFLLPILLLLKIILLLYTFDSLSIHGYIHIQKDAFFFINSHLKQYPILLFNLTQFGDALIFLSILSILILYTPKVWESLIIGSILSLLLSVVIKEIFLIPRPAAVFDNTAFNIIGKRLSGSNSFPSGHSITVFTTLSVLMFAFAPTRSYYKYAYFFLIISIGLLFAFTRVAVGAHYPLDVLIGSIIGYISGLLGTFISIKYNICSWICNKKYYPFLTIIFLICCVSITYRIITENLMIYYLALISLVISTYKITLVYAKKY